MVTEGAGRGFRGPVQAGDARGRTLGFPTANVAVGDQVRRQLPTGVYVGLARVRGAEYGAVVNIGQRPTFGAAPATVEVHLLDFTAEIYGEELEVRLLSKLRDEQRFATPARLAEQIHVDVARGRAILAASEATGTPGTGGG